MTSRLRLPNRRTCVTFDLEHGGMNFTCTCGRFADGRLSEIFLSNHKAGSGADVAARDSAIVCSIALQYGADAEAIRRALSRDSHGNASGPLGRALDLVLGATP
jgi:hypothetical protein